MSRALERVASVEGIGFWAPRLPCWAVAREALRGSAIELGEGARKPAPPLLPSTERRRASDSVVLAMEVAVQACQSAGRDPRTVPGVFASMHGDLAITDYTCATLAAAPTQISPTRFHNSVHNAPAGYWSIGTGCRAPYTALAADVHTFAEGLLEALVQLSDGQDAVLLVAYDIEACGPLAMVSPSTGLLGMALVLGSPESQGSGIRLTWDICEPMRTTPPRPGEASALAGNAMAAGLPLFEALAADTASLVTLDLSRGLSLRVRVSP